MRGRNQFSEHIPDRLRPLRSEIDARGAATVGGYHSSGPWTGPYLEDHHRDAPLQKVANPKFQIVRCGDVPRLDRQGGDSIQLLYGFRGGSNGGGRETWGRGG